MSPELNSGGGPRPRPKSFLISVRHALNGLLHGFRTQKHLRVHFAIAVAALMLAVALEVSRLKLILLIFAVSLVIVAELFNTVVETVVDMLTSTYHPQAKVAKDLAAAGVLTTAVTAGVVTILIFFPEVEALLQARLPTPRDALATFVAVALLLLVLIVVGKARGHHGTFMHGGVISGHTAIAFALSTSLIIQTQDAFLAFLAILLALLVSQSRVDAGIHSVREVIYGAALGVAVPAVVFLALPFVVEQAARALPALGGL